MTKAIPAGNISIYDYGILALVPVLVHSPILAVVCLIGAGISLNPSLALTGIGFAIAFWISMPAVRYLNRKSAMTHGIIYRDTESIFVDGEYAHNINSPVPPRLAQHLLRVVLHYSSQTTEAIIGDLHERFEWAARRHGISYARVFYRNQVARSVFPFLANHIVKLLNRPCGSPKSHR
jgi:hypothetical protein